MISIKIRVPLCVNVGPRDIHPENLDLDSLFMKFGAGYSLINLLYLTLEFVRQ